MDKLTEGSYTGTPSDWRVQEINGKVAVQIRFQVKLEDGTSQYLNWTGWLTTPKAKKIALKALMLCGWRDQDLVKFGQGREGKALDPEREVVLDVITETSPKDGKEYCKVQWVNAVGFASTMTPDLAKRVEGMDLGADLAALAGEDAAKREPADGQCTADEDDLPF